MPSGIFYQNYLGRSISKRSDVKLIFILTMFIEIHVLNANSVNLDQTPRSAESDQSLHCLPMSLLWDARHKWVNINTVSDQSVGNELMTCFFLFCPATQKKDLAFYANGLLQTLFSVVVFFYFFYFFIFFFFLQELSNQFSTTKEQKIF